MDLKSQKCIDRYQRKIFCQFVQQLYAALPFTPVSPRYSWTKYSHPIIRGNKMRFLALDLVSLLAYVNSPTQGSNKMVHFMVQSLSDSPVLHLHIPLYLWLSFSLLAEIFCLIQNCTQATEQTALLPWIHITMTHY